MDETIKDMTVGDIIMEALQTDGEHHKQWYLEQILEKLGINVPKKFRKWEEGIAP